MLQEIRISLSTAELGDGSARDDSSVDLAASVRSLLLPMRPRFCEPSVDACSFTGAPLVSAVIQAAAPASAIGVELLPALTRIDASLELDVCFVPDP
ncbi:hypothetical protein [Hymenobacter sp.]|uniref:hypothetical protein n=1 Tax=Hymenobacter sp. TaxID=1898978 RepID=UPI00286A7545|nr:hypothetical protein [Hymenobacter sp.]